MADGEHRIEQNLIDLRSKLQSLFNRSADSTIDETFLIFDSTTQMIVESSKNSKKKRKFIEIVSVLFESYLRSDVFCETLLKSNNKFLRRSSMKLITTYGFVFDHKFYYDLSMDFDQLGILAIDSFENILRLTSSDDVKMSKNLISSFRKLFASFTVKADLIDIKYLFNVWKISLTIDSKNVRDLFFKDFVENWQFYSIVFEKVDENLINDYCTIMDVLNVLNRLLTICLENYVFNSDFDRTKFVVISRFVQSFYLRLNFSSILEDNEHWFGGILAQNSSSNGDKCLRRILILILLKSETILNSNENSNFRNDFLFDSQSVVDLFLDQDDQFCELLLCNFLLEKKSWWNCNDIVIHFLQSINWNHEVLLDWIISEETLFLQFFTRYLKKSASEFEIFMTYVSNFEYTEKCSNDDRRNEISDRTLSLTVQELLGDVLCSKTIQIRPLVESEIVKIQTKKMRQLDATKQIIGCFECLKRNLSKLNEKKLAPFNVGPLIKILNRFLVNFEN